MTNKTSCETCHSLDPDDCHSCQDRDPDDCLDLALEAQAGTLAHLEREIFEAEKHALTDWHGRLNTLHEQHFEAARRYEALNKELIGKNKLDLPSTRTTTDAF